MQLFFICEQKKPYARLTTKKNILDMSSPSVEAAEASSNNDNNSLGIRVSGKQWKATKTPVRASAIAVSKKSWDKKLEKRLQEQRMKAKEKEMKEETDRAQKDRIQRIKDRRAAKEEKERYELMAQKMHAKKVARLRKKEKRNKMLKER